jgi:hypothetical protein
MFPPAATVAGPLFVMARLLVLPTGALAVAVLFALFESPAAETLTVLFTWPGYPFAGTCNTSVKVAVVPEESEGVLQEIVPVPPGAGIVHDHPAGDENDTNVVFGGVVSLIVTLVASLGPLLVTLIV